jgi:nicotinamide-nucleotide adenylyltransferase
MKIGLYVGRFQPFHLGHLFAVKFALEKVDFLKIVLGSSQKSHELRNPFTCGERIDMIREALFEQDIDCRKWQIIPIPDIEIHTLWISLVKTYAGRFDVVFSNDPLTLALFREEGMEVIEVPLQQRADYSGTEIRRRMVAGEEWRDLVPNKVARIIEEINGIERVKALALPKKVK